jgi:hypothetical protein
MLAVRPPIVDERVTWHVGDVETTLPETTLTRESGEIWILFFDLDIFEPSIFAWEHLRTHLRPGDILYFDEACDRDERHLIDHHVLPTGSFELIAATPLALALEIRSLREAN